VFNVKNKVYVKHIDKFAPHEGEFILLDGGEYKDVYFPEDTNFLFRYDSLSDMLEQEFEGSIAKFWDYISNVEKLRIYTADDNDYATLFIYTMKELFETFDYVSDTVLTNVLEMYETSDFIQENRDIKYASMTKIYNAFQPSGKLYTAKNPAEIPLEFILIMYKNEKLSLNTANIKVTSMAEPMLVGYLESQLLKVVGLITSHYDVLESFLGVTGISTPIKLKTTIANDSFLSKLICDSIVDIHQDLDQIIKLYTLAYSKENDTMEDDHVTELMVFVDLFKNPDIDSFVTNFEFFSCLSFFTMRYLKFNEFVLKSYMV